MKALALFLCPKIPVNTTILKINVKNFKKNVKKVW